MTWSIKGLSAPIASSSTSVTYNSSNFGTNASKVTFTGTAFTYDATTGYLKTGTITSATLTTNNELVQSISIPGGLAASEFFNFFSTAKSVQTQVQSWGVTANDPTEFIAGGNLIISVGSNGTFLHYEGSNFSPYNNNGTVTALKHYAADGVTLLNTVTFSTPQPLGYVAAGLGGEFGFYHYLVQGNNTVTQVSSSWLLDLDGGAGTDSLINNAGAGSFVGAVYKQATGAVVVDLVAQTATGAAGTDTLSGINKVAGSNFNDTITGNSNANYITGDYGNDTIAGGAGNDTILGGFGNDSLSGGSNDDLIVGGIGNDTIDGGDGNDTASYEDYEGPSGGATVSLAITGAQATGVQGTDTLISIENLTGSVWSDVLTGNGSANIIHGLAGNDVISSGAGSDKVYGEAGQDAFIITNANAGDVLFIDGGTERDLVDFSGLSGSSVFLDLGYNVISGPDTVNGNNLSMVSGAGRVVNVESIIGTQYDDIIRGDSGSNNIIGGAGNDTLLSYSPYDTINPYASLGDVIEGGAGNDLMYSGTGNDYLDGGSGNDTIEVGGGTDTVITGTGNDIVFFSPRNGTDTITDFTGGPGVVDVLKLYGLGTAYDTFAEVYAASSQQGANTVINFVGQDTTIILQNFTRTNLVADDIVFV